MSGDLFMIWPDEWPLTSILTDFQIDPATINVIRPKRRETWIHLNGTQGVLVLDPCSHSDYGELGQFVRARTSHLAVGWSEVRMAIKAWNLKR